MPSKTTNLPGKTAMAATLALVLLGAAPRLIAETSGKDEKVCPPYEFAMGLRYQQQSAEVDALQRQAFRLARIKLDQALASHEGGSNLALITDVDETLIDNTPLLVRDMRACRAYQDWDTWSHWERAGSPALNPGAKAFLDYADAEGVTIFYVSNRFAQNEAHTLATLNNLGLPQVSKETVKLWREGDPKTQRRAAIRENHEIVLLLGDTLADFDGAFEGSLAEQRDAVRDHADRFGSKWIVFPNATYGDWSEAKLKAWSAPVESGE